MPSKSEYLTNTLQPRVQTASQPSNWNKVQDQSVNGEFAVYDIPVAILNRFGNEVQVTQRIHVYDDGGAGENVVEAGETREDHQTTTQIRDEINAEIDSRIGQDVGPGTLREAQIISLEQNREYAKVEAVILPDAGPPIELHYYSIWRDNTDTWQIEKLPGSGVVAGA